MYTEKNHSYIYYQKEAAKNRVTNSVPVQGIRQPVSQYLPNQVRLVSKNCPDVKQLQVKSRHMTNSFQPDYKICQKKSIPANRMDTEPANIDSNVIQRAIDWYRFQKAFNCAGVWLDKAAENVLCAGASEIFAQAKIKNTERIAYHIIGSVSRAYNTVQQILTSQMEDALAWVDSDVNTIINISEEHVNQAPIEDVATTILHELSHYGSSLGTDDIEYFYTTEEFEQGSEKLTYETAKHNADTIAFFIRKLAELT